MTTSNHHDLHYKSAMELTRAMANRTISSVELLEETIKRIEALDDKINAVVVRDFDQALASAKKADMAIAQKKHLPLLGLPMTVKESFNVAGLTTTWGNPHFKEFMPEEDALAVTRLKKAGAIILGKTNVPLMLKDWQSYNDLYGTTNNPWDLNRTPGGSSGGAAAALAAGFVSLELGSDLAGSLRVPAHCCGVFTHKPTQDVIPVRGSTPPGTVPFPSGADLVTIGPMARSVEDLLLAFNVLAGPDEMLQGKGFTLKLPAPRHKKLANFKVLVLDTHPLFPTNEATQKAIGTLAENLIKTGVNVSQDSNKAPCLAEITQTYAALFSAFVGVNLPDHVFDKLKTKIESLKSDDLSLEAIRLRAFSSSFKDYFLSSREREVIRLQWLELFNQFDVVVCPVMPTEAFPHDHSDLEHRQIEIDGKKMPYFDQFVWSSIATPLGFPATVVPIAQTKTGMPIGVQIIGGYMEDYTTLKFAELIESEFGGFKAPPF